MTVGSREYPFDRLLIELDKLVENNIIRDPIFAQIGQSNYLPENFEYQRFLGHEEFKKYQNEAELIISHGGTGALIGALKAKKNVIAVPRLAKYKEHIDDHQLQVTSVLQEMGYLRSVTDITNLGSQYINSIKEPIEKGYDRPSNVVSIIETFIDNN
ncbi:PssE/Cps14G family polysaccharide biosynthesis glycosyltransferase [Aerococcus urinaeequi]